MLWLQFAIIALLILLNGFFALAEMAVVSARRVRLQHAADLRRAGAKTALELRRDPGRFLSTVQIGITVIGVFASVFGGAAFADQIAAALAPYSTHAHALSYAVVVIAISYLTLIFGELVPKRVALRRPEAIARGLAPLLRWMIRIVSPIAWFLSASSNLVLFLIPLRAAEPAPATEEEIAIMLREGQATGQVHAAETAIVQMALRLGDRRVGAVMTPRTQVEWLDLNDPDADNLRKIGESHYSRFPVFEGGLSQVAGIVQVKEVLTSQMSGKLFALRQMLRPPLYIPETATALRALEMFRQSGEAMLLVVDEFGDFQGLVTLHDIVQALVGDIAEPGEAASVQRRDDGSYVVDGMTPVDMVKDLTGLTSLVDEAGAEYHTLGGFIMARMHRIPAAGNQVTVEGFRFEVLGMDGRRVDRVLIVPPQAT
jgi:magnesium and cobalt exporter, CNNM family